MLATKQSNKRYCVLVFALAGALCSNVLAMQNQEINIPEELQAPKYENLRQEVQWAWDEVYDAINENKKKKTVAEKVKKLVFLDRDAINAQKRIDNDSSPDTLLGTTILTSFIDHPGKPAWLTKRLYALFKPQPKTFLLTESNDMPLHEALAHDFWPRTSRVPTAAIFELLLQNTNSNSLKPEHLIYVRKNLDQHIDAFRRYIKTHNISINDAETRIALLKQTLNTYFTRFTDFTVQKNLKKQFSNPKSCFDVGFIFDEINWDDSDSNKINDKKRKRSGDE